MIFGGIAADSSSDETPNEKFNLTSESFPVEMRGQNDYRKTINNWSEFTQWIEGRPPDSSEANYILIHNINGKPISIESVLRNETAAQYLYEYNRREMMQKLGVVLSVPDYGMLPNILYGKGQAFEIIKVQIGEIERQRIQLMKRKQENAGK